MRGFLASSIGVTCAAALAVPLAPPVAAATSAAPTTNTTTTEARPEAYVPGSTQSLPLAPLVRDRTPDAAEQGVPRRAVRHFSLVGVVWDDPATELHGRVQVRTRAAATGTWSGWQELETHTADHAADPDTPESTSGRVRGATAPLWVGESDGVEVRVRAESTPGTAARPPGTAARAPEATARAPEATTRAPGAHRAGPAASPLPTGLRLELVDPGKGTPPTAAPGPGEGPRTAGTATEIPALDRARTAAELLASEAADALTAQQKAKPYVGPRPKITTRRGWGADEKLRERKLVYTKKVKAAFVHHSATGNNYRCSQAPSVIRSIYRYHVKSMGWRDIGYNFLIDKCGKIYEGRAGGVSKAVLGAHTLGFNSNSMGIAVLGTYSSKKPSSAAVKAIARLTAWKLGLYGMNPRGKTYLKSGGGNLYRKGKKVRLNVISGHRDGFATSCPGKKLYAKLRSARSTAAKYQGR
ncbi:peptidoglycan recognition protein [Streptomyces sp. AC627_RSS907]|uniref:peptidoglycan recognition protein family protein n=1 Tax=Streptomyces sp. AC627_RSS907 TaxID=2823684 RepID=UPI001C2161C7|nr:peptidoglycan recognition protein [Streptomyces sp. AC627_RSS907]